MATLDYTHSLAKLADPVRILGFCLALLTFCLTANYIQGNGLVEGFEAVGIKKRSFSTWPSKFNFFLHGRDLAFTNMARLQKAFYVSALEGPVLLLPARYIDEIKYRKSMSFVEYLRRVFLPTIPGFESNKIAVDGIILKDIVRTKLTQTLEPVNLELCEQAHTSVNKIYGQSGEWTKFDSRTHVHNLVAAMSTRVFLGERMTHNQEWIRITVDFTINMMIAVRSLKIFPSYTYSWLHWIIPHCILIRRDRRNARRIIDVEIAAREKQRKDNAAKGIPPPKFGDAMAWMIEAAGGEPFDLADTQLALTFVATLTTGDLINKTLYHIAANPDVATALRKEVVEVLKAEGWRKQSLTKMRFLDSLMKEVQRINPASAISVARYTTEAVTFNDGTHIPKGQMCAVLTDAMMQSEELHENPLEFDPWRYVKLTQKTGDKNRYQFVTTSPEQYAFGHGIHACPGRFFASNEIKIALVFLVLNYDFRVVDLEKRLAAGREPVMYLGLDCITDPQLKLEYKRRTAEVNPVDFCVREATS